MSLKYSLTENRLANAQPDEYLARVQNVKSHDLESIIAMIATRGNSSHTTAAAVLEDFFAVIGHITSEGEAVNTDLFKTNLAVSGIFHGSTEGFDPKRHSIKVNVNPGKVLKEALANVHTAKVDKPEAIPHILEVKDSISGSANEHITSGGVLDIAGSLLKIEGDSAQNGVALIDSTGKLHKVKTIVENKPSRLFVMLPKLDKGEYTLQVTTQYTGSIPAKTPRAGAFHKPLTVV